jgi:hypothetical protein
MKFPKWKKVYSFAKAQQSKAKQSKKIIDVV